MRNFALLFLLVAITSSCSQGGDSSNSQSGIAHQSSNVAIIEDEDLSPGLKGIDANNNGIRDDIDRLIAKKYSGTPEMKKAVEQDARSLQIFMEATTRDQARLAAQQISRSTACTFKVFPHSTVEEQDFRDKASKEIEALTANTKERFAKYWGSNGLIGGMVFDQAKEPVCD